MQGPEPPTAYAPFAFSVGSAGVSQITGGLWVGDLSSVSSQGDVYGARAVVGARRSGRGVRLMLSTSDPSGRRLVASIAPGPHGAFTVTARPEQAAGVATMMDSFTSPAGEAFHGFGGRHDGIDQHGDEFYSYLQQENVGSGATDTLAPILPGGPESLFPNGPAAAYYVQSSFISSAGYGFMLDRDSISDWRLDSDRPDAWQVESFGPSIRYLVAPGRPANAIRALTAIGGRQRVPPRWAVGPALDRLVEFPADDPAHHAARIADDIANIDRYRLPLDAYRIEGWQFLDQNLLKQVIAELRRRGIHPMVYFRAFVGKDTIGTDDPAAFDTAVSRGYVATHADGSPYIFQSNFNADGAVIDFTNPAAVRWWQSRITRALKLGADGFMEDFGEQVLDDMHFADGSTGRTMHNRLPVLYHRATLGAVRRFEDAHPGRRIFYFSRAGYSGTPGSARYEFGNFPGDETTDWGRASGLKSQAPDMLNRAVGGAHWVQHRHWRLLRHHQRPDQRGALSEVGRMGRAFASVSPARVGGGRNAYALVIRPARGRRLRAALPSASACARSDPAAVAPRSPHRNADHAPALAGLSGRPSGRGARSGVAARSQRARRAGGRAGRRLARRLLSGRLLARSRNGGPGARPRFADDRGPAREPAVLLSLRDAAVLTAPQLGFRSVIAQAVRTLTRHWRVLLIAGLLVFIPVGFLETLDHHLQEPLQDPDAQLSGPVIVEIVLAAIGHAAGSLFGEVIYGGIVASMVIRDHGGRDSLRDILRHLPLLRLIAIDLLWIAVVALGFIALVVPGLVFMVWFALVAPTAEIEGLRPLASFRRSRELVRSRFWLVAALVLPVILLGDLLADLGESVTLPGLGHGLAADWFSAVVSDLISSPPYAMVAVILFLGLRAQPTAS